MSGARLGPVFPATTGGGGGGSGTVTSVAVASANGLAGTVANATTTPTLTLSTTITGLLKGNGTAISAAVAGTDYLSPTGSGAGLTGITVGQVSGAAPLASPALTGVPTGPTAALATNTTQLATTAFVIAELASVGSGTVTSVSVASANGFAGTVATPTTTPAITLTTSITGLLKGNGTAISAATAGTDYVTPTGSGASLTGITNTQVDALGALKLTAVKTANYTAVNNDLVAADISASSWTVQLPTAPPDQTIIGAKVVKVATVSNAFLLTVATGGSDVFDSAGGSTTSTLALLNQQITYIYNASQAVWTVCLANLSRSRVSSNRPVAVSANYSALGGDIVLGSGGVSGITITLPTPTLGQQLTVKKVDSAAGAVTLSPTSGLIDGAATLALSAQYQAYQLVADGTNWNTLSFDANALPTSGGTITGNLTINGDLFQPVSSFSTTTGGFVGGGYRSSIGHLITNVFTQSVGPVVTTAAGASIGANIASITTLIVADAVNPPSTGQLTVLTSGGTAVVNYTSWTIGTKTFGGVTLASGSGTILSTVGGVQTNLGGDVGGNIYDPFIGSGLIVHYSPTVNYFSGVGPFGTVGPITYTGAAIGPRGLIELEGTVVYKVSQTWFTGSPPAFQNEMIYRNDPASAVSFCVGEGFVNVPQAIGDTVAANFVPIQGTENKPGDGQNWTCGYGDLPVFATVNGGTLGATNPGQIVSFYSMPTNGAGVTVSQRLGLFIHDMRGAGTVTTQYGARIGQLQQDGVTLLPMTGATTNIGIDCANTVLLGGASATATSALATMLQLLPNTYTYNYSTPVLQPGLGYSGTHIFQQTTSQTSAPFSFSPTVKNLSSVAANLGYVTAINVTPTFQADTQSITLAQGIMFAASPQFSVANSGTLSVTSQINFQSTALLYTGATITLLRGFFANNFLGVGGAVTTHVGVDIAALSGATNNIGLRNASTTVWTPSTAQVVAAGFTVTANARHVQLTSSGSVSATTAAAVITAPNAVANGQVLTIVNANTSANTLTFTSGATELLSLGAATRAVAKGGSLSLVYNSTFGRWVEIGFNAGGN